MFKLNLVLLIITTLQLICSIHTFDIELTVLVPANQRECFHQILEQGKTIEVEYEVLAGGDLDINYWLYSPSNRVLHSDLKKRDGHQTLKLEETGEYRFCLDNAFSRFSQKQVYFSLRPLNEHGQQDFEQETEEWMKQVEKDQLGDLQTKLQDIKVKKNEMFSLILTCLLRIYFNVFGVIWKQHNVIKVFLKTTKYKIVY